MDLGLFLSSEEHPASDLLQVAVSAETSGIDRVLVSDHYHPWLESQGHSPFVWSVLGGIASTTRLTITTGVTCPTMRIHPAVIAQAAATMAEPRLDVSVSVWAVVRPLTSTYWATPGGVPIPGLRCWKRRSGSCASSGRGTWCTIGDSTIPSTEHGSMSSPPADPGDRVRFRDKGRRVGRPNR